MYRCHVLLRMSAKLVQELGSRQQGEIMATLWIQSYSSGKSTALTKTLHLSTKKNFSRNLSHMLHLVCRRNPLQDLYVTSHKLFLINIIRHIIASTQGLLNFATHIHQVHHLILQVLHKQDSNKILCHQQKS